jgi:hypothetical protein
MHFRLFLFVRLFWVAGWLWRLVLAQKSRPLAFWFLGFVRKAVNWHS